jgi:hypothetical protein
MAIKVRLLDTALRAVSFEIDDLIGKVGEVTDDFGPTKIVSFPGGRVYDLPEHCLEVIEDTAVTGKIVKSKEKQKTPSIKSKSEPVKKVVKPPTTTKKGGTEPMKVVRTGSKVVKK